MSENRLDEERPLMLVIDDQYGWNLPMRRSLCARLRLRDVTAEFGAASDETHAMIDASASKDPNRIADAVFHSGQTKSAGGEVRNSTDATLAAVRARWPRAEAGGGRLTPGTGRYPARKRWALVILDLAFNEGHLRGGRLPPEGVRRADAEFGVGLLSGMRKDPQLGDPEKPGWTDVPVVVISTTPREQKQAMMQRLGAMEYLDGLKVQASDLADALFRCGLFGDVPFPRVNAENQITMAHPGNRPRLLGHSLPLYKVLRDARRVAETNQDFLVLGAVGSGKELVSRFAHAVSSRMKEPFEGHNCAEWPSTLLQAALFGLEADYPNKGTPRRPGWLETVGPGTLMLDELGEIAEEAQVMLLRLLAERVYRPLGADHDRPYPGIIVGATNRNIYESPGFRRDLLSRLQGLDLVVPSLAERREDIPELFAAFLNEQTVKIGGVANKDIDQEVLNKLVARPWPGNIRELRRTANHVATVLRKSGVVTEADIPEVQRSGEPHPNTWRQMDVKGVSCRLYGTLRGYLTTAMAGTEKVTGEKEPVEALYDDVRKALDGARDLFLVDVIDRHGANVSQAAEKLGMSRSQLHKICSDLQTSPIWSTVQEIFPWTERWKDKT